VARFGDPEPLDTRHILEGFGCGRPSLDSWLLEHARTAAAAGSARTYVVQDGDQRRVVAYHALAAASVKRERATSRAARSMPRPIPAVLLARLAVDASVQGRGLGAWMLQDAMTRTLAASRTIGVRAMLVHALDEQARAFCLRLGLEPAPTDPLHLMILIKDSAASLGVSPGRRRDTSYQLRGRAANAATGERPGPPTASFRRRRG
jgi:GNAT superfamily N-acetyltransferase